jgi:hypothetical protein
LQFNTFGRLIFFSTSGKKKDLSTDYTDYHGFSFVGFSSYRLAAVIGRLSPFGITFQVFPLIVF